MDRNTLNEILDFAEETGQLNHSSSMLAFYEASVSHTDKKTALEQTMSAYDLSWHKDYKEKFYNYERQKFINIRSQDPSFLGIPKEELGKSFDRIYYTKYKDLLDKPKSDYITFKGDK
jgi:hypothetical protein